MMILLIVGLIKKILYKNDRSLKTFGRNIDAKVDLSNYARKADVKNITHIDTVNFASETNLAHLKTEINKLDTDKLKTSK